MAALGSTIDSLGPFVDGDAILDGILRRPRSAWPAAFVTTREITPQLLGPLGCPIDEGISAVVEGEILHRSLAIEECAWLAGVSRPEETSARDVTDTRFPIQQVPTDKNQQINGSHKKEAHADIATD